jgi:uncharacterized protein (TIGR03382 family)
MKWLVPVLLALSPPVAFAAMEDGGSDGGGFDGGQRDGGHGDGGFPTFDGGFPIFDGGRPDAGLPPESIDLLGCSCSEGGAGPVALVLVALAVMARQRRRLTSVPPSQ